MKALYFKEIRSFLSSIIGYVFILIFLSVSGSLFWIFDGDQNLLQGLEADLIPFFNFSPTVFLLLIPAITMKSIAEERRTGTIELLFTRPISDLNIILAKFFACTTLLLIALLPTLIYYYSMYSLSEVPDTYDHGATITSYLGLFLLGTSFIAIGIFTSSVTSSQIVAFILALFLCWFFLPEYGAISLMGSFGLFGNLDSFVLYFGMGHHYDAIQKGVIDTKNIIYFLAIIVFFIYASLTIVKQLKR